MDQKIHLNNPLLKDSYQDLSSTTGIYIFRKGEEYLYVGKSTNIKARVMSHVENSALNERELAIIQQSDSIETRVTDSEFTALLLESQLIQKYHPKYNIVWKDGKSHLYIKITHEVYPKIFPVRKEHDHKSLYFGPFSSTRDVDDLLRVLRRIIPYCTQKKITNKPCFYSKINQCDPCPSYVESLDHEQKQRLKKEYRTNIRKIISILNGKSQIVLKSMHKQLNSAIKEEQYEQCILIRHRMQTLEYLTRYRSFERYGENDFDTSQASLKSFHELIKGFFPQTPNLKRIECYDISNLSQKEATGSMVVLTEGLIDKNQYRKFKIKNKKIRSDFEMLEEVVRRRFHNKWTHPSLMVIDGGKPQIRRVMSVLKILKLTIPVIGIAKHPDRFVIGIENLPTIKPKQNDMGYRLIQMIRDESHRFARKYHLLLRQRSML